MARTYLDFASTTPLRPAAVQALSDTYGAIARGELGDPSRSHSEGLAARELVEACRSQVASLLGARGREVVFCSGATEATALASFGALTRDPARTHSVASAIEHAAVRTWVERGPHSIVGTDEHGSVSAEEFCTAVRDDTAIAHLQWANHEVGTVQPIEAAGAALAERDGVLFHVDAAQVVGRLPVDFRASGADLMSISGHKFGAPGGIGALLIRRGVRLDSLITGGDQERARRAGIENVAGIAAFAAALFEATSALEPEHARLEALRQRIVDWAAAESGVDVLGHPSNVVSHLVCLQIEGIEPQPVLIGLDRAGIAVHSGNSCSSEALEPSPVLAAMGADAQHSLRVSLGWSSTDADVDHLLRDLPRVLAELRALRG